MRVVVARWSGSATQHLEGALDVVFGQVVQLQLEQLEELLEVYLRLLVEEVPLDLVHLVARDFVADHLEDLVQTLLVDLALRHSRLRRWRTCRRPA